MVTALHFTRERAYQCKTIPFEFHFWKIKHFLDRSKVDFGYINSKRLLQHHILTFLWDTLVCFAWFLFEPQNIFSRRFSQLVMH